MFINRYIQWRQQEVWLNGNLKFNLLEQGNEQIVAEGYRFSGTAYPKFYKMDLLSKLAFMATELLGPFPDHIHQEQVATIISTASGCIEVDKKFEDSRKDIASPALFVYTLPNIMLGEICIRHGFKGEQLCTISPQADSDWLSFWVNDLLGNESRNTSACLCGHVEATTSVLEATLMWVNKDATEAALPFDTGTINQLFNFKT